MSIFHTAQPSSTQSRDFNTTCWTEQIYTVREDVICAVFGAEKENGSMCTQEPYSKGGRRFWGDKTLGLWIEIYKSRVDRPTRTNTLPSGMPELPRALQYPHLLPLWSSSLQPTGHLVKFIIMLCCFMTSAPHRPTSCGYSLGSWFPNLLFIVSIRDPQSAHGTASHLFSSSIKFLNLSTFFAVPIPFSCLLLLLSLE